MAKLQVGAATANLPRYVRLADFVVDFEAHHVYHGGRETRVPPKAMAVLRELTRRPFEPVSRQQLFASVWGDSTPNEEIVTQAIAELRRAFEEQSRGLRLIETVPRVGYRLRVAVDSAESATVLPMRTNPPHATGASAALSLVGARRSAAPSAPVAPDEIAAAAPESDVAHGLDAADAADGGQSCRPPAAGFAAEIATSTFVQDGVAEPAIISDRRGATRSRILVPATCAVAVVVLALLIALVGRSAVAPQRATVAVPPVAAAAPRILQLTADPLVESFPALSPDGSSVAFSRMVSAQESRIVLRGLDAGSGELEITASGAAVDEHPVWSPDGRRIAFLRTDASGCQLMLVAATGGAVRALGSCASGYLEYFDWTPDGSGLLSSRVTECRSSTRQCYRLTLLDIQTGALTPIAQTDSDAAEPDLQPKASPDGRWIAFRRGVAPFSDLYLLPLHGGAARRLTHLAAKIRGMAWYPDSSGLLFSSDHEGEQALYRIDLVDPAPRAIGVVGATFPAIARQAEVAVYVSGVAQTRLLESEPGSATAGRAVLSPSTRSDAAPAIAPDGSALAFLSNRTGHHELWLHRFAAGTSAPLTGLQSGALQYPQWSPDSRSLLVVHRNLSGSRLLEVDVGSGRTRALGQTGQRVRFGSYSSDGRSIYVSSDLGGDWRIWRWSRADGSAQLLGGSGAVSPLDLGRTDALFYINERRGGLYRIDPASGRPDDGCLLGDEPDRHALGNLQARGEWLYFAAARGGQAHLLRRRLATLECAASEHDAQDLGAMDDGSEQIQATLFPDAQRVIIAAPDHEEIDVYALQL